MDPETKARILNALDAATAAAGQVAAAVESVRSEMLSSGGNAGQFLNIGPPTDYHQQTINNMQAMIDSQAKQIEALSNRLADAQQRGFNV